MTDEVAPALADALSDRYRLERELGRGGMATVYLARDLKHDRSVALKVIHPELAAVIGAERFLAEIKVTANLQHPHILPLFDSGQAEGLLYYVMPFVAGESLRARLSRERQLPIEDAVRITQEVAWALDYAHRQSVVHRDVKPENILLQDGAALVADFGIALAVSNAGGHRLTQTGLSLGTPQYMSPEQATGERTVDGRSDLYSLACTLYEMLAGEPPFTGPTAQAVVAKAITDAPPPVTRERPTTPSHVREALERGLQKLPADRFATAADFARALETAGPSIQTVGVHHERGPRRPRSRTVLLLGLGTVIAVTSSLVTWSLIRPAPRAGRPIRRWSLLLPDSAPLAFIGRGTLGLGRNALNLSPDGSTLVYVARRGSSEQLFRRRLDEAAASPIRGTEGAYEPFFSPDGQWIGFFTGTELRKVPVSGGAPTTLAQVPEAMGASWTTDGRILLAAREGDVLAWAPVSGGSIEPIPDPQRTGRSSPRLLPGGAQALVALWNASAGTAIGVTDVESGKTVVLTSAGPVPADSVDWTQVIRGDDPRYLLSGHLSYVVGDRLMVAPFDLATLRLLGTPVQVLEGLRHDARAGQYAVAPDGTLIYASGRDAFQGVFVWADSSGRMDSLSYPAQVYGTFDLAPHGGRVVTMVRPPASGTEIWVLDPGRSASMKVVTQGIPSAPRWWPDGRHVMFTETSPRPPYTLVTVRQLPGSAGQRDTLAKGWSINDVSPDTTRSEALGSRATPFGFGVWLIPLTDPSKAAPVDTFPSAWGATFSRDGRWIAYTSNEAGHYEIYVVSRDLHGERQKVSLAGGEEPRWSPRGDKLVYRWGQQWFAVSVPPVSKSEFGRPRLMLTGPFINVADRSHDISRDGRHLVIMGPQEQTSAHLEVVTNWLDEVRRLSPVPTHR